MHKKTRFRGEDAESGVGGEAIHGGLLAGVAVCASRWRGRLLGRQRGGQEGQVRSLGHAMELEGEHAGESGR